MNGIVAKKLCNTDKSCKYSKPCDIDAICLSLCGFDSGVIAIIFAAHDNDI